MCHCTCDKHFCYFLFSDKFNKIFFQTCIFSFTAQRNSLIAHADFKFLWCVLYSVTGYELLGWMSLFQFSKSYIENSGGPTLLLPQAPPLNHTSYHQAPPTSHTSLSGNNKPPNISHQTLPYKIHCLRPKPHPLIT